MICRGLSMDFRLPQASKLSCALAPENPCYITSALWNAPPVMTAPIFALMRGRYSVMSFSRSIFPKTVCVYIEETVASQCTILFYR